MQPLEQRINFYQEIFRKPEIRFPFSQMLGVLSVLLVLLLMFTVFDYARTQSQRGQIAKLEQSKIQLETAEKHLSEQLAKLVIDPALEKQDAYLRETLSGKQQFLAELQRQGDTHQMHFSGVLNGLASLDVKTLWLTRIYVQAPGPELSLNGLATEAKAVPAYLSALKNETVFDGLQFRMLNLERLEERSRYLTFSVSTQYEDKLQH